MIEKPESFTIARQLNEHVKGKRIVQAHTAHTPQRFAFYSGEPEFYSKVMEGKVIGNSLGIGSMVELELEDEKGGPRYSFVIGDGTNIRYHLPEEKLPQRYQTRLDLEDGSFLVCTVQMYGSRVRKSLIIKGSPF